MLNLAAVLNDAYRRVHSTNDGSLSAAYPILSRQDHSLFGLAFAGGRDSATTGDADVSFPIMSVSKPFVFALVCENRGVNEVVRRIGFDATGLAYNSIEAIERNLQGRTNPMVTPGAISAISWLDSGDKWTLVHEGLSLFAGRELGIDASVHQSVATTNFQNRLAAQLLARRGALNGDPTVALDVYNRQISIRVNTVDLSLMGATLANGGVNPRTGRRIVGPGPARAALISMAVAGLYENSGSWLLNVGVPAKSGISGGILAVAPGRGAISAFSPRVDSAGNSVRGQLAIQCIVEELGLDLFKS